MDLYSAYRSKKTFKFVQRAPKDASFLYQRAPECVLAVQGRPRSMILVPIASSYATSYYWVIVTMVLSCTVSEIRRLIG